VIKNMLGRSHVLLLACTILSLAQARGQARGNWPLPHNDAEHSGWQKAETKLSKDAVAGQFKFLWKIKLERKAKDTGSFSEPLLAPQLINAEGFKDLVLWGGKDTVYAVDSELGTMVWQKHFDLPAAKGSCGAGPLEIFVEPPRIINGVRQELHRRLLLRHRLPRDRAVWVGLRAAAASVFEAPIF
jgi:hypothetical protein